MKQSNFRGSVLVPSIALLVFSLVAGIVLDPPGVSSATGLMLWMARAFAFIAIGFVVKRSNEVRVSVALLLALLTFWLEYVVLRGLCGYGEILWIAHLDVTTRDVIRGRFLIAGVVLSPIVLFFALFGFFVGGFFKARKEKQMG